MTVPPRPGPRWLGDGQLALAAVMAVVLLPVGWTSVLDGGVPRGWAVALVAALVVLLPTLALVLAASRVWPGCSSR